MEELVLSAISAAVMALTELIKRTGASPRLSTWVSWAIVGLVAYFIIGGIPFSLIVVALFVAAGVYALPVKPIKEWFTASDRTIGGGGGPVKR